MTEDTRSPMHYAMPQNQRSTIKTNPVSSDSQLPEYDHPTDWRLYKNNREQRVMYYTNHLTDKGMHMQIAKKAQWLSPIVQQSPRSRETCVSPGNTSPNWSDYPTKKRPALSLITLASRTR